MDILEVFGLQVLLEDKTSDNARKIGDSLRQLGLQVGDLDKELASSFQRLESVMHSGYQIALWGSRMIGVGNSMSGSIGKLGKTVMSTAGEFEMYRMKLNNLYGDVAKGEEVFQYAVKQALITPFNVQEYVASVAGLKVSSIDPLKQYVNEKTGEMQDMITFAGDLAAAYGKNMNDAFFSLKEAIAGNDFRSLRGRFDGLSKQVIEATTGQILSTGGTQADIDQRAEVFAKFIGMKFGGMMTELGGSWTGLISRLKENFDVFKMQVGDSGFFAKVKDELLKIILMIEGDQDAIVEFAKVTSDALMSIVTPISKMIQWVLKGVKSFVNFSNEHPKLAKFAMVATLVTGVMTTLGGVIVMISGTLVTMIASLATLALNMRMSHGQARLSAMLFQGFGKIMFTFVGALAKAAIVSAIFTTVWSNDLGGLRTKFFDLKESVSTAFEQFNKLVSLDYTAFKVMVDDLNKVDNTANSLTKTFATIYYTVAGFFDYLSDGLVSADTVKRLDALGSLGFLENLIKAESAVRSVINGIADTLVGVWNKVEPILTTMYDGVMKVVDAFNKITGNSKKGDFGDVAGEAQGKFEYGAFKSIGNIIGSIIALSIATKVGKTLLGIVLKTSKINNMIKTAYIASRGMSVMSSVAGGAAKVFTNIPNFLSNRKGRNANGSINPKYTSGFKKITWGNLIMDKIGRSYNKTEKLFRKGIRAPDGVRTSAFLGNFIRASARNTKRITMELGTLFTKVLPKALTGKTLGWGRRGTRPSERQLYAKYVGSWLPKILAPLSAIRASIRSQGVIKTVTGGVASAATGITKATGNLAKTVFGNFSKVFTNTAFGQLILKNFKFIAAPLASIVSTIVSNPIKSAIAGAGILLAGLLADAPWAKKVYEWLIEGSKFLVAALWSFFVDIVPATINLAGMMFSNWITYGITKALPAALGGGAAAAEAVWNAMNADIGAQLAIMEDGLAQFGLKLTQGMQETFGGAFESIVENGKENIIKPTEGYGKDVKDIRDAFGTASLKQKLAIYKTATEAERLAAEYANMSDSMRDHMQKFDYISSKVYVGGGIIETGIVQNQGYNRKYSGKDNPFVTAPDIKPVADTTFYTNNGVTPPPGTVVNPFKPSTSTNTSPRTNPVPSITDSLLIKNVKGQSTGGNIRSTGVFQLHEGESVVNDPTMNSFESGIRRFNALASRSASNQQSTTEVSTGVTVGSVTIQVNVPESSSNMSAEDIVKAVKDPSVLRAITEQLAKAKKTEDMRSRKPLQPSWGVSRL